MSTTVTGRQYNIGKVCATINGRPAVALAASAPLSTSWNENTCTINIAPATTTTPGYLSAADKIKLDNLAIAIGETSVTAYRGDRGKVAYDHSQIVSGNPHGITKETLNIGNVTNYDQSKAINSITRSGTTFTYTCLDGTDGTFTQQDTTYSAATAAPLVDGTASVGVSEKYAREDHVHPTDTSRASTAVAVANGANGLMSGTDKAKLDSISIPTTGVSMPVIIANQNVATFNSDAAGRPLHATVNIQPMQASGTPSPSNPLPITGRSGVTISRTGKNLLKFTAPSTSYYTINADGTISGVTPPPAPNAISIGTVLLKANVEYTIAGFAINTFRVYIRVEDNNYTPREDPVTFTPSSDTTGIVYLVYTGAQSGLTIYPMLYKTSDPPSAYEEYRGHSVTVSFGGAGTVYGGTLDVARGLLTVAYKTIFFTGNNHIYTNSTTGELNCMARVSGVSSSWNNDVNTICSICTKIGTIGTMRFTIENEYAYIYNLASISGVSDTETAKAWLDENQPQIVYPLATPITYQLTPQPISTLVGTNNVFADCGTVDVTYWPGTGIPMTPVNDENNITLVKNILTRMDNLETAIVQMGGTI